MVQLGAFVIPSGEDPEATVAEIVRAEALGVLATAAASIDRLSGGRFELGLGAGAFWDATAAMGGPRRSGPEQLERFAAEVGPGPRAALGA